MYSKGLILTLRNRSKLWRSRGCWRRWSFWPTWDWQSIFQLGIRCWHRVHLIGQSILGSSLKKQWAEHVNLQATQYAFETRTGVIDGHHVKLNNLGMLRCVYSIPRVKRKKNSCQNFQILSRCWQSSGTLLDSETSIFDTIDEPSQSQPKQPRDYWSRIPIQQRFQGLGLRGSNLSLGRMGTGMDVLWNMGDITRMEVILLSCVPGFKPRS